MQTEYSKYEPIFGSYRITKLLGEGSYGKVYEIVRQDFGVTYKAALKVITIPKSQTDVKNAMSEGMDRATAETYFRSFVEEMTKEFALMDRLKGNSNIVNYEDHTVIEHVGEIGWDVLIRMELLTPLTDHISGKNLPIEEVVRLGIDICKALEICDRYNIIHRDIKPENIFVSELGNFKLGDFGIARVAEKSTGASTKVGTYSYMAPEILKNEIYTAKVDQYSLGLVLYRLLNNNRLPFLPPAPQPITYSQREAADAQRVKGTPIPAPVRADEELSRIVLKATAYNPNDRYISPRLMRNDLERYLASIAPASAGEIVHTPADPAFDRAASAVPYEKTVMVNEEPAKEPVAPQIPQAQPQVQQTMEPQPVQPQVQRTMEPQPVPQPVQQSYDHSGGYPQNGYQQNVQQNYGQNYQQSSNTYNNMGGGQYQTPKSGRSKLLYLLAIPAALLLGLIIWGVSSIVHTDTDAEEEVEVVESSSRSRSSSRSKEDEKEAVDTIIEDEQESSGVEVPSGTYEFFNCVDPSKTLVFNDKELNSESMSGGGMIAMSPVMYIGDTQTFMFSPNPDADDDEFVLSDAEDLYFYLEDPDLVSIEPDEYHDGAKVTARRKGECLMIITDGTAMDIHYLMVVDSYGLNYEHIDKDVIEDAYNVAVRKGYTNQEKMIIPYETNGYILVDIIGYLNYIGEKRAADRFKLMMTDDYDGFFAYTNDEMLGYDCTITSDGRLMVKLTDYFGYDQEGTATFLFMDPTYTDTYAVFRIPYKVVNQIPDFWLADGAEMQGIYFYEDGTCEFGTEINEATGYNYDCTYTGTYTKTDTGYKMTLNGFGPHEGFEAECTMTGDETMTVETTNGLSLTMAIYKGN